MATWIMEDEEEDLEVLELFKEARRQIDDDVPRGDRQAEWLLSRIQSDTRQAQRWFVAHRIMFELERNLDYGDQQ